MKWYCLIYVGYWHFNLHRCVCFIENEKKTISGRKHLHSGDAFPTRTSASSWGWTFRTPAMFHDHVVHGHVSRPPHSHLKSIKAFTDHCILEISPSKDCKDLFMTVITAKKEGPSEGAAVGSGCPPAATSRTCLLPKAWAGSHYCSIVPPVNTRMSARGCWALAILKTGGRKDPWEVQRRWKWKVSVNDRGQEMRPWRPRVDLLEPYWG